MRFEIIMTKEQFVYWLQGFAELNETPPTAEQWQSIKEHLQTVFQKVTPPVVVHTGGHSISDLVKRSGGLVQQNNEVTMVC